MWIIYSSVGILRDKLRALLIWQEMRTNCWHFIFRRMPLLHLHTISSIYFANEMLRWSASVSTNVSSLLGNLFSFKDQHSPACSGATLLALHQTAVPMFVSCLQLSIRCVLNLLWFSGVVQLRMLGIWSAKIPKLGVLFCSDRNPDISQVL